FVPALALQYPLISAGAALRGSGVVKPTMLMLATTVVLNLVLAPVLIFGWGTGRPLGVTGAAIATLTALVIGTAMLTVYITMVHTYLRVRIDQWKPSIATWREVIVIGVPSGAELGVLAIYLLIVYSLLRPFRAAAPGGFAAGARIVQSLILPALGRTVRPLVSAVIRLISFFVPAIALSRAPSFSLNTLWAISAASIGVQAALNLIFVAIEFRAMVTHLDPPPVPHG